MAIMDPDNRDGELVRRRVVVSGRVQGVGFRAFVVHHAERSDIAGTVRNTAAGDVECVLEGAREAVAALIDKLRGGPSLAHVTGVEVDEEEPVGERSFRVTH